MLAVSVRSSRGWLTLTTILADAAWSTGDDGERAFVVDWSDNGAGRS